MQPHLGGLHSHGQMGQPEECARPQDRRNVQRIKELREPEVGRH